MLKIAAEGGPEKNSVCCLNPPFKPFKFGSKHLFSCSGIASGLCSGLALFQKIPYFEVLFHFISETPPHPPPHPRTGNLKFLIWVQKFLLPPFGRRKPLFMSDFDKCTVSFPNFESIQNNAAGVMDYESSIYKWQTR